MMGIYGHDPSTQCLASRQSEGECDLRVSIALKMGAEGISRQRGVKDMGCHIIEFCSLTKV